MSSHETSAARAPLLPEVPLPPARLFATLPIPTPFQAEQLPKPRPTTAPHAYSLSLYPSHTIWPPPRGSSDTGAVTASTSPPRSPIQNFARSIGAPHHPRILSPVSAAPPYLPTDSTASTASAPSSIIPPPSSWGGTSAGDSVLHQIQSFSSSHYLAASHEPESDGDDASAPYAGSRRRRRRQSETPRDAHLRRLPCSECGKKFARVSLSFRAP